MQYLYDFITQLRGKDFVILDTETTGLDRGEIVEIAIIDNHGNELMNTLVKPKMPIPLDATRIHGINDASVANAPTWPEIQPDVLAHLLRKNVIIYNAVYDRKMMHQTAERWNMPPTIWKEEANFFCAMEAYAIAHGQYNSYRGTYTWQRLSSAFMNVGGELLEAHRAMADCLMTLSVVNWMLALDEKKYKVDESEIREDESEL